ncbi:MAG: GNAT family N-acetyltransferase, partial [Campylobacterota bacterium]|nr:GNAT family N-acetyltransferase [Campylobacterota bacterium]
MQTRELTLKEVDIAYDFLKDYISLSYEEFEDKIYDLRHNSYKMLGMFHKDVLIAYCGVNVMSTLQTPKSLWVYE